MQLLSSSDPIHRTLRKSILGGVGICVAILAYSILRYPGIVASPAASTFLPLFLASVLWFVLVAYRMTPATTREEFVVLQYGARWGVVIGLVWIMEVVVGNVIMPNAPVGLLATLIAVILPGIAGAAGTAITGRVSTGARIGFWSGVVSGLIAFAALAAVGCLVANYPEFLHNPETPPDIGRAYTAVELATYNLTDYLADGVSHLFIVGAVFCSAAGAIGGLLGRTARSSAITLSH